MTRVVTADDVRTVELSRPPLFQRGYAEDEVDNLLDEVVNTLEQ